MNVLITGGAGYIGSACTEYFLNAGHAITVYDNLSEGHRSAVHPKAQFVKGDCLDRVAFIQALQSYRIEAVVHFAASALVGESMKQPGKYFHNNTVATHSILEACVATGVRKFVFSSTCATFGVPETDTVAELHPQRPVNPYGESKLLIEKMLPWYRLAHELDYVGLRYFNAAGATKQFGEHHRIETHLIPNVLKVALNQSSGCEVFGSDYPTPDGTCVRDYIHVEDLAQAHLLALAPGKTGFSSLSEAQAYLEHSTLGGRLQECTRIVLTANRSSADEIFGQIDALKFRSCMTLFSKCSKNSTIFRLALEHFFNGKADARTLQILGA